MAKRQIVDDIPEITGFGEVTDPEIQMPDEPVEEAPEEHVPQEKAPRGTRTVVSRILVANDYEHNDHPARDLYAAVQDEYGTEYDPWKVTVLVKMGRKPSGEADKFAIRVNGRKYELAYKQNHKVPLPIAIAWLEHQMRNEIAEDMADTMTERYQDLATQKIL